MRTVAMVVLVACGSSPTHPGDGGGDAKTDAPADAGPINHWTFNGATYSSPTATCNTPTGAYWFMSATAVETSGHDLVVYFLYPSPPAPGTYGCIGNPNNLVAGQAVIAAGDAPRGVWYATGGTLTAAVADAQTTATFSNVPTELGSSGMFSMVSGSVTCP
jgi:hypothetical protein